MDLQLDTELNLFSDFLSIEFDRTIDSALNLDPIFSLWPNQRVSSMIKIISLSEPNVSDFLKTAVDDVGLEANQFSSIRKPDSVL